MTTLTQLKSTVLPSGSTPPAPIHIIKTDPLYLPSLLEGEALIITRAYQKLSPGGRRWIRLQKLQRELEKFFNYKLAVKSSGEPGDMALKFCFKVMVQGNCWQLRLKPLRRGQNQQPVKRNGLQQNQPGDRGRGFSRSI